VGHLAHCSESAFASGDLGLIAHGIVGPSIIRLNSSAISNSNSTASTGRSNLRATSSACFLLVSPRARSPFRPKVGGKAAINKTFGSIDVGILTYNLTRQCLNEVVDAGGRWLIEGGTVEESGTHVANYSSVCRVSCGTTELNVAQLWMTLFYLGEPLENITLHGAHEFASGTERGSVSAASSDLAAAFIGKPFKRIMNTLSIEQ
jgi:hypothetical protein